MNMATNLTPEQLRAISDYYKTNGGVMSGGQWAGTPYMDANGIAYIPQYDSTYANGGAANGEFSQGPLSGYMAYDHNKVGSNIPTLQTTYGLDGTAGPQTMTGDGKTNWGNILKGALLVGGAAFGAPFLFG